MHDFGRFKHLGVGIWVLSYCKFVALLSWKEYIDGITIGFALILIFCGVYTLNILDLVMEKLCFIELVVEEEESCTLKMLYLWGKY